VWLELKSLPDPAIVDFDKPVRWAIEVRDQCVAFFGISSSVATRPPRPGPA